MTHSHIDNNDGTMGGGIYAIGNRANVSILQDSSVSGNHAAYSAGAIYSKLYSGSQLRVDDSTISGNTALGGVGGGLYARLWQSSLVVENHSSVDGNTANGSGGGIVAHANEYPSYIRVSDSTVSGNTAADSGGGLYAFLHDSCTLVVEDNSEFSENTAVSGKGGGIYVERTFDFAPPISTPQSIKILASTVSGNHAFKRGGGVYATSYDGGEMLVEGSHQGNRILSGVLNNG